MGKADDFTLGHRSAVCRKVYREYFGPDGMDLFSGWLELTLTFPFCFTLLAVFCTDPNVSSQSVSVSNGLRS